MFSCFLCGDDPGCNHPTCPFCGETGDITCLETCTLEEAIKDKKEFDDYWKTYKPEEDENR